MDADVDVFAQLMKGTLTYDDLSSPQVRSQLAEIGFRVTGYGTDSYFTSPFGDCTPTKSTPRRHNAEYRKHTRHAREQSQSKC